MKTRTGLLISYILFGALIGSQAFASSDEDQSHTIKFLTSQVLERDTIILQNLEDIHLLTAKLNLVKRRKQSSMMFEGEQGAALEKAAQLKAKKIDPCVTLKTLIEKSLKTENDEIEEIKSYIVQAHGEVAWDMAIKGDATAQNIKMERLQKQLINSQSKVGKIAQETEAAFTAKDAAALIEILAKLQSTVV